MARLIKKIIAITPTPAKLKALQGRSGEIRDIIGGFGTPWIVEFAGMPRSGKSECIATVVHFLRRNGHPVLAPFEGASQAPEYLKNDLTLYNSWTASYAIRQIIEGSRMRAPSKYDFVLLDRGLFDATAWFHYLEGEEGKSLKTKARKVLTEFICLELWRNLVKQVFLFVCTPKTSLQRELASKLTTKEGVVLSEKSLARLRQAYTEAGGCYNKSFDITVIKTDNVPSHAAAYSALCEIFSKIESRHRP